MIPALIVSVTAVASCRSSSNNSAANAIPAPPDVASPPPDATRTPTGLAFKVLQPGHGDRHPRPSSQVTVNYTGWTTDGKMFDSTITGGQPATFGLDHVIPGWTEGVQMMVEGEKCRFWIPQPLAYDGESGMPAGMLVFDIELIRIDD
ncbi:MAG: FKBP-type peptidyl-prolyl cis-trans isomerase [Vicinamibacterales bacterium]